VFAEVRARGNAPVAPLRPRDRNKTFEAWPYGLSTFHHPAHVASTPGTLDHLPTSQRPRTTLMPAFTPTLRLAVWTALVVALLGGQIAWLRALRGPALLDADALLIGGQITLAAAVVGIAWLLATTPGDAIKLRPRISVGVVLGGAVALQAAAVAWLMPVLSDDWVRYRTDGLSWLAGWSPYAVPPADPRVRDAGDDVDRLVPHGHLRTIYPPVAQALFAAMRTAERAWAGTNAATVVDRGAASQPTGSAYRDAVADGRTSYAAAPWKLAAAGGAVAATIALLAALRLAGASPWWAVLFAWNPLVVLETGGMAHVDALGAAGLVVALVLARRRPLVAAAAIAMAVGVKPVAVVVVPFLLRDAGPAWRRAGIVLAVALAVTYGPALVVQRGHAGWRETATTFARHWEANGSVYELAKRTLGPTPGSVAQQRTKDWSKRVGAAAVVAAGVVLWRRRATAATAAYVLLGVMLLVAPVAYPWYLVWPLAVVPLLRGRAGWAALAWSGTAVLAYRLWREPTWTLPAAWALAEYAPVYAAAAVEWWRARTPGRPPGSP